MELVTKYLSKTNFESYEDFKENLKINIPEDFDFTRDIVDTWARLEPNKKAVVYCNDENAEKILTFSDISLLSKKAATYFLNLGIQKRQRVILLLRRRYEYWICATALHRIGAVVVPASVQMAKKDIAYRVKAAKATAIIAVDDEYVMSQLEGLTESCHTLCTTVIVGETYHQGYENFNFEYSKCAPCTEYSNLKNHEEMLIYFTSGTTGYPKMTIHNRTYPLGHIITAKYMQRVKNNGLHLTQADSGWAKFGWGNIYGQWICGSAVLAYDPIRFSSVNLMNTMEKYKPSSLCIPPTMYRFLLHDGLEKKHVQSIQWFSTAGEALSGEVNKEFFNLTGHYIHEAFGQSEGTPITCNFEFFETKPSSMGKPSPLYDVRLIDSDGNECKTGEKGEVVIFTGSSNTVGLLTCYEADGKLQNPIQDGIYHTGDIACKDNDGYFWYCGRTDDMIKCSGYRIGPFEIESILNSHPSVKESAIVGYPDEIRGQVVCAVVVLKEDFNPSEQLVKELQDYVKKHTAPYKYPRIIKFINTLPKTTSGKIIRKGLVEQALAV